MQADQSEQTVYARGDLKEIGAKMERFRQEGEYRAAALDSVRELTCLLSTQACKPLLVVTQNKKIKYNI